MYSDGNQIVQYVDEYYGQDKEEICGGQELFCDWCVFECVYGGFFDCVVFGVFDFNYIVLVGDWNSGVYGYNLYVGDYVCCVWEIGYFLCFYWEINGDVLFYGKSCDCQNGSVGGDFIDEGVYYIECFFEYLGVQ